MSLLTQAPEVTRAVAQSSLLHSLATLQIAGIQVGAYADSTVAAVVTWLSRQAMTLVGGLTLATLNVVVALFCLYYLLIAEDSAWDPVRRLLPFSPATIDLLADRFRTTTESMMIGIVLTALAQGTVVGVAFALVGLPGAAFWGFVTACTSVLPLLGSAFVWLPGTLVLAADHRYGAAMALGAVGVIVASQIDNVIRLLVYRRVSRIHPLVTLVGAFAGLRVFGLVGLLLGPLGISLLLELLKVYSIEFGRHTPMELAPPIESGENSSDSPVAPQELPLFGRTV
jgi:predicted PurR-regulated permease PerM